MPSAVGIRTDFSAAELRRLAASSKHANQSRRLLSLAAVLDGMSREEAARIGGMDRQTLRDWVHRFNAEGPDGLKDIRSKGQALRRGLSRAHDRQAPEAARLLAHQRAAAPSGPEGRDHRGVQKNFAATLTAHLAHIPKRKPIEIWFQDEARIGQKNGLVRQWARRGTRPRQPADQRYESAYLFGAICPARGVGAALAMPFADTQAMQAHLGEIGSTVARGAHAVLLLDRAGWHTTQKLTIPKNLTLILLPSRSPELNPVENIWQFLRANWLSNRVFETYDEIIGAACEAWNKLTALPAAITSIGMRDWAHIGHS
jgi:hypothetical protein